MLDQILEQTRKRVAALEPHQNALRAEIVGLPDPLDFVAALSVPGLSVVAEIKRRSPSAGLLAPQWNPPGLARTYVKGGAAAISVLTEPDFFGGGIDDLQAVSAAVAIPILRKDFMIHPVQIWEARIAGADAVLLILSVLGDRDLRILLDCASEAGLSAVLEVHTLEEVKRAVAADARVIGVNNRDLETFVTDLRTAEALASHLPDTAVCIAESGVATREGAARMHAAGYDGILVGEALIRADNPAMLLAELRK